MGFKGYHEWYIEFSIRGLSDIRHNDGWMDAKNMATSKKG